MVMIPSSSGLLLPESIQTSLPPMVDVYVHPINSIAHPSYAARFRWAVMIGGAAPHELNRCANAGGTETHQEACVTGEAVGAAVALALRAYGVNVRYRCIQLTFDPMPAAADDYPLVKLRD